MDPARIALGRVDTFRTPTKVVTLNRFRNPPPNSKSLGIELSEHWTVWVSEPRARHSYMPRLHLGGDSTNRRGSRPPALFPRPAPHARVHTAPGHVTTKSRPSLPPVRILRMLPTLRHHSTVPDAWCAPCCIRNVPQCRSGTCMCVTSRGLHTVHPTRHDSRSIDPPPSEFHRRLLAARIHIYRCRLPRSYPPPAHIHCRSITNPLYLYTLDATESLS